LKSEISIVIMDNDEVVGRSRYKFMGKKKRLVEMSESEGEECGFLAESDSKEDSAMSRENKPACKN